MPQIPRYTYPDATISLRRDPYHFIARTCRELGHDLFQTRILLKPTVCITGYEAARMFYTSEHVRRSGAAPARLQQTLFGKGGVQALDDEAHRVRKRMMLSFMTPDSVALMGMRFDHHLNGYASRWEKADQIVLYDQVRQALAHSACDWAGVPLNEDDVEPRLRELTAMFDTAGSIGPRHWYGRVARNRAERWAANVIDAIRRTRADADPATPAEVIALHRNENGDLLSPQVAAVELLNLLRPTVAVGVYIVHIAHALHAHPECAPEDSTAANERFVQEVRRMYPFFPATLAKTRTEFEWQGYAIPAEVGLMLDLHGTNHDPRLFADPDRFNPDRFLDTAIDPFNLIPQGGGDHAAGHRCAGEWITIDLMKRATRFLAHRIRYAVPNQKLDIDYQRLPAMLPDGFVMREVKRR